MASTITSATMTVTITEKIVLNGRDQGAKNTLSVSSINEISKRIVTATTNKLEILSFGTAMGKGSFVKADVRYMRFTNLDDTNFLTLTFRNQDNDEFAMKVDAGNSFMLFADNSGGMVGMFIATQDADANSDVALGSLTNIQADANTGNCDLEVFIASTNG